MKIVECVPNFSNGRDKEVIDSIIAEINKINRVNLLDVDMGYDTNRTVVTFAGPPDKVVDAAFNAIKKAAELIDMTNHSGAHPRMGATDVCPLVPVKNISIDDCVELSKQLAKRVGDILEIPVYLYEYSATSSDRVNLANIRSGEFENMPVKLKTKSWEPDFGPSSFKNKAGVTAIGAREFLIAYNINLNTADKKIATDIALDIRENGRAKRDKMGKIVRDKDGVIIKVPGTLKDVKAVGWYIDEYNIAQVSINLINYKNTPLHIVFEEVRKQANKRGLRVTGSEIVGLVPQKAIIDAGVYYLNKQKSSYAIPTDDILNIAVSSLGLNDISKFNMSEKIVEYCIDSEEYPLLNMKLNLFINELSRNTVAPGGGSVSALVASLSVSLISMVCNITFDNKKFNKYRCEMHKIALNMQRYKKDLASIIDEDTKAFNMIVESVRLPKKTSKQMKIRDVAIHNATINAIETPYKIMKIIDKSLIDIEYVIKKSNPNCLSDLGVAVSNLKSAVYGALLNVHINLKDLQETSYSSSKSKESNKIFDSVEKKCSKLMLLINSELVHD